MNTNTTIEIINRDRRRLVGTAAAGIAVAAAASLLPSRLIAADSAAAIRPFRVNVPREQLADLRRRIAATRWPDKETVDDQSQGVPARQTAGAGALLGQPATTGARWKRS